MRTERPDRKQADHAPRHDGERGGARSKEREIAFRGIPIVPGVAIGPLYDTAEIPAETPRRTVSADAVDAERARLADAVALSRKQLGKLKTKLELLPDEAQHELAPLLDAYVMMLGNSRLLRGARKRIENERLAAETAVLDEAEAIAAAILAAKDDDKAGLYRRAAEIREIARRLMRNLTATPFRSLKDVPEGSILVAEALTPADAALLDPARIAGVATEEGGADGHTAIMLRALGIPSVLGCAGLCHEAARGAPAVLDGTEGTVVLWPGEKAVERGRESLSAFARERAKLGKLRRLPAVTTDGEAVELQANLEIPAELPLIAQAGAHGIGLLRTEFLFMNREDLPDEEAQLASYAQIVDAMGEDPVTIRVLDWGGEKDMEAQNSGIAPTHGGPNPALGLRGL
ncbi:MAG: Phosphoenolpyruvate-protein phosphotransferase of PTS system, partial [uncultured Acetobacteraceae bacterium]